MDTLKENEVKIPDDLLLEIQAIRDELTQNVIKIGRINVQVAFLKNDMVQLENELSQLYIEAGDIAEREEKMQQKVTSEYGNGFLNFESGVFVKTA